MQNNRSAGICRCRNAKCLCSTKANSHACRGWNRCTFAYSHTHTRTHTYTYTQPETGDASIQPGCPAPYSPALLLSGSWACGCGSGPCSFNEPMCLMKRTHSVWLGGDGTSNSCCHHCWGITPLYQLPSLIHHTHGVVHRWIHPHLCKQLPHTFSHRIDAHCCTQRDGLSMCVWVCVCLTSSHASICTHWNRKTPSSCPAVLLSLQPAPASPFIPGLNSSIPTSAPSVRSHHSVTMVSSDGTQSKLFICFNAVR